MQDFNVNFNWIEAWLKQHFKLIIKIITPFIILILGTYFIVRGKQKFKRDRSKELFLIFFSFISMPFFFLKFPLYRYGYSYIIVFIIIFFIVFFFKSINQKKLIKIFKIYLFSSIIILVTKQANRIVHFWETRNPIPELSSNIDFEKKFNKIYISSEFFYYLSNKECYYEFYPCTNIKPETLKFKKIYTFKILYP
jgi:cell division protein FtsW (lipid II flippase)